MLKYIIPSAVIIVVVAIVGLALDLTDIPNLAATGKVKEVVNANNAVLEAEAAFNWAIVDSTQLVYIATETNGVALVPTVTNVVDSDITN